MVNPTSPIGKTSPEGTDASTEILNTSIGIGKETLSINELTKLISNTKDPHEQINLLYTLYDKVSETWGCFSTLKIFPDTLKSFLLKTPITPGTSLQEKAFKLVYGLGFGKEFGSALASAELAGIISEFRKRNHSRDFINAAKESIIYTLKNFPNGIPKHELLNAKDYRLIKLARYIGSGAEEIYKHIKDIRYFSGSLLDTK